jgi:ATP-dependent Clp protease ATP-binding subunit ClpA
MSSSLQPQPETDITEKHLDINSSKGDLKPLTISKNLSDPFIDALIKAMNRIHERKGYVLDLKEFTTFLLSDNEVRRYLEADKIDLEKIITDMPINDFQGNTNPEFVVLHPDLKTQILEAYNFAINHNEMMVSTLNFIKSVVEAKSTNQNNNLTQQSPNLAKLSTIMTEEAGSPIVDRDEEVRVVTRILLKPDRNNLILIGDQGIGKTYLVHKFISLIKSDPELSSQMLNYEVLKINFPELLSIAQYKDEQFSSLLEEINKLKNKIFYFPNLDLKAIAKDGLALEYIFSSFLKDPSNRVIIGCSYNTNQNTLQKVGLFQKNFETLTIEEPKPQDLITIINNKLGQYSTAKGLSFSQTFINDLIEYSKRFLPSKAFPDKALNLLEEIIVQAKLKKITTISSDEVKEVIAQKTGIPLQTLSVGEKDTLLQLESELNKVIIGQKQAVKSVVEAIQRSRVGLKNPNKPIGSFLFLGPTGVGKTEFAKQLARIYFKDEKAFMRFDMSEFGESHTNQKLIGAPPGYAGYEDGGVLTNYVMQKPYSLLLFDEVEKAHPKTYDLFLQILDDGRLTDSKGKLADFKNTILIFTSNIGSNDIALEAANPASLLFSSAKEYFDNNILPQLSEYLRIELINRFDEIIPFLPLDEEEIYQILLLKTAKIKGNIEAQGYKVEFAEADLRELAKMSYDPKFGAREIDRVLRKYIENPLAQGLLKNPVAPGGTILWKLQKNEQSDQMPQV